MTESTSAQSQEASAKDGQTLNRRKLFAYGGGSVATAAVMYGGYRLVSQPPTKSDAREDMINNSIAFRGEHQAGVVTPMQLFLHMAAFNIVTEDREDLIQLLKDWTLAAERLSKGEPVVSFSTDRDRPTGDTGEALDLKPSSITITFGFGKTMFKTEDGKDRFGLASKLPPALDQGIPATAAEFFEGSEVRDGDLLIQVCAEDSQVAVHAIHNLTRIAFGKATIKWAQLGYGRASATSVNDKTPRNLFGFKDGTMNLKADQSPKLVEQHLWVNEEDEGGNWLAGGTYFAYRKFRMLMEMWDELTLQTQEESMGRTKVHGNPLSGGKEFDDVDFKAVDAEGNPLVPDTSHIAQVHPSRNNGAVLLRRSYNYTEGADELGRLNAGLHFIAYVRDPRVGFNPILQKMARNDELMEYLKQVGTAMFACPPGVKEGEMYIGQKLFEG